MSGSNSMGLLDRTVVAVYVGLGRPVRRLLARPALREAFVTLVQAACPQCEESEIIDRLLALGRTGQLPRLPLERWLDADGGLWYGSSCRDRAELSCRSGRSAWQRDRSHWPSGPVALLCGMPVTGSVR